MVNIGEMMKIKRLWMACCKQFIIFMPYIISFLTTLVVWVIKKIIEKFTYDFQPYQGDSRRIARKKARRWAT